MIWARSIYFCLACLFICLSFIQCSIFVCLGVTFIGWWKRTRCAERCDALFAIKNSLTKQTPHNIRYCVRACVVFQQLIVQYKTTRLGAGIALDPSFIIITSYVSSLRFTLITETEGYPIPLQLKMKSFAFVLCYSQSIVLFLFSPIITM